MSNPAHPVERLRLQQIVFARFTTHALSERNLDELLTEGVEGARMGAGTSHAKLLEYIPAEGRLLMRAGVGWKEGYVGHYKVAPDVDTPIGVSFALAESVSVEDYRKETRFRFPQLLRDHACVSSINVPVRTEAAVFGVLEVDHIEPRAYTADDVNFLTGLANTVAAAVELNRALSAKSQALAEKDFLMHEMNHRIKNNLALVASLLAMQSRHFSDPTMRAEFDDAISRIHNLALVHDRLRNHTRTNDSIDAGPYLNSLCEMLQSLLPGAVQLECLANGHIPADQVESLSLIANELVTNAAKYAFPDKRSGRIEIGFRNIGLGWQLTVRDDGIGLPQGFSAESAGSFGMRLVRSLTRQLHARLVFRSDQGTKVEVTSVA
jgi:two-component sensor histidine kinase